MARLARLAIAGQAHHLIQRGNNGQAIFLDDEDRRAYLSALRDAAATHTVAIHAYVLMDNHVHLLATPAAAQGLSRMMQALGRRYVSGFNRRHRRSGTLWEGRFRAAVIESERYFLACMRYIETNPVRSGLVSHPADYPWSSHAHHSGQRSDPLVTDHSLFWSLGNTPFDRQSAYKLLSEQPLASDVVQALTTTALKSWALGSAEYLQRIGEEADRRVSPRSRGRPRKQAA
jgi:REP-associated tyrosine transposase